MGTAHIAVRDGRGRLPEELFGQLHRKIADLVRRVDEGTLDYQKTMRGLQMIIENRPLPQSLKWHEHEGFIYLSVTSDGTIGRDWVRRLRKRGVRVSQIAENMLCSEDFQATKGVTYQIAICVPGHTLVSDNAQLIERVRVYATKRNLIAPNAEVACLIRDKFTNEDVRAMGLMEIVTMHDRIRDHSPGNVRKSLLVGCEPREPWLDVHLEDPETAWITGRGLAFVASQTPTVIV